MLRRAADSATREGTRYAIVHGTGGSPVVGPCTSCVNPTAAQNNLYRAVSAGTQNAIRAYGITGPVD